MTSLCNTKTLDMGRPPKPKHLRRSITYVLRLTPGEMAELESAARQSGTTVAGILRDGAKLCIQRGKGGSRNRKEKNR